MTTLNSATEHDHLPVAARTGNTITLVWVRHDTRQSLPWLNPKSDVFYSSSPDGRTRATPTRVTIETGDIVNLFPALYANLVENTSLSPGYSHRIAPTPTPGVFLGMWVQGPDGAQDVYYRVFRK